MNPAGRIVAGFDVAQTGNGRHLLLLHSLLADRDAFATVLPALAARFTVTAPNLPGYGLTGPAGHSIEDFADRVAAMMDALALPSDTAVLGNGLGGFVAGALAVRHGGRFGRLLLVDTGPAFPPAGKAALRALADRAEREGMTAVLDAAVARMFPPDWIAAHPDAVATRKACLAGADPRLFALAARAIAAVELTGALPSVRNPTLVMVGKDDQTTPPAMSHALVDLIPGAALIEIDDCGHCPQVQAPEAFVRHVAVFATN
ncbi:MAG: alpha/beta fold hydrolase [Alphaproteobacteria bacterium]